MKATLNLLCGVTWIYKLKVSGYYWCMIMSSSTGRDRSYHIISASHHSFGSPNIPDSIFSLFAFLVICFGRIQLTSITARWVTDLKHIFTQLNHIKPSVYLLITGARSASSIQCCYADLCWITLQYKCIWSNIQVHVGGIDQLCTYEVASNSVLQDSEWEWERNGKNDRERELHRERKRELAYLYLLSLLAPPRIFTSSFYTSPNHALIHSLIHWWVVVRINMSSGGSIK